MVKISLSGGGDIWLNPLLVKSLQVHRLPGTTTITMLDKEFFVAQGDPATIANEVFAALQAIHTRTP